MKHKYIILALLAICHAAASAQFPVSLPDYGNGRLVVCCQNTLNYFVDDLDAERPSYHDQAGLEAKTERMVSAFLHIDADIYALCELECKDAAIAYLTNAMNAASGKNVYDYVDDGLNIGNQQIKSGFIYRKDKVEPFGENITTSSQQYYRCTMRLQGFQEIESGERFILSMNHFKAKDSTDDQGNAKREKNAADLVASLSKVTADPDILILGDMNCLVDEPPLQQIVNAGYTEMLLKYDPNAYSYYYYGYELIDHAFANSSMSDQIEGAGVFHLNTYSYNQPKYRFSDHDTLILSLNLNSESESQPTEPTQSHTQDFKVGLGDFTVYTPEGSAQWYSNASYGAIVNGYNMTGPMDSRLVSKEYDLSNASSASISFRHNIYYENTGGQYADYQTLWYTTDPAATQWTQIEIPRYGIKQWVDCTIPLPDDALKSHFRYAFRYQAPSGSQANYWEIDNTTLSWTNRAEAAAPSILPDTPAEKPRKFIRDGSLYIQVGDRIYTSSGLQLK